MAKIDALLEQMKQQGATRALLQADAPCALESGAGIAQGQPFSDAQIQAMLDEIIPVEARQSLQANGLADFTYSAPSGAFNLRAMQSGGQWNVEIHPVAVPFATATEPVIQAAPPVPAAPAVEIAKNPAPVFAPPASPAAPQPPASPPVAPGAYSPANLNVSANDSGQGDASTLPPELRGFNWGALLGSWIWGIGNNVWIGLLAIVPCVGFFMRFYLGAKGNEMAWKSKRWDSVQSFRSAQTTWTFVGIALIGASLFMGLIMSAILFPVFARARENARRSACQSNLKQISLAALQFSQDHKDKLPKGTTMAQWKTQLTPYMGQGSGELFVCPSHQGAGESYEVNPALSNKSLDSINNMAATWMFAEPQSGLHLDGSNIGFADGHIKWFKSDRAQEILKGQ